MKEYESEGSIMLVVPCVTPIEIAPDINLTILERIKLLIGWKINVSFSMDIHADNITISNIIVKKHLHK